MFNDEYDELVLKVLGAADEVTEAVDALPVASDIEVLPRHIGALKKAIDYLEAIKNSLEW